MDQAKKRIIDRLKRARTVSKKIKGTSERPRLTVRRSLRHIYAQIIDDVAGNTLVQLGSKTKGFTEKLDADTVKKNDIAKRVGETLAELAKEKGIEQVVFDRKGYRYHGRVKSLADGARSKGLKF